MRYDLIFIGFTLIVAMFAIWRQIKFKMEKNADSRNDEYDYRVINYLPETDESYLLSYVNVSRIAKGLTTVQADVLITELAHRRNIEMIRFKQLSHSQVGDEFQELMSLGADSSGENVGYGYSTTESCFKAWIKSKGHRENILNPKWDYCGIGVTLDSNNRKWYCILFVEDKQRI